LYWRISSWIQRRFTIFALLQSSKCLLGEIIQGVPGGKVNILGGYSIGHSKQKTLYEHVSYSERFSRYLVLGSL
jgi:hypothetical protein